MIIIDKNSTSTSKNGKTKEELLGRKEKISTTIKTKNTTQGNRLEGTDEEVTETG